jgi:hypothetical protein
MSYTDPDDKATEAAAEVLKRGLDARGHTLLKSEVHSLAFETICKWISSRAYHWAVHRGKSGFGDPDAYTVGFAEAALSQIADKCGDLPMDQPIGKWAKNDVARLFSIAHAAIQATMERTLETVGEPEDLIPA